MGRHSSGRIHAASRPAQVPRVPDARHADTGSSECPHLLCDQLVSKILNTAFPILPARCTLVVITVDGGRILLCRR